MNQIELNKIAMSFLKNKSDEVASKLREVLRKDVQKRVGQISGRALNHIHNMALFNSLICVNALFAEKNDSMDATIEYAKHVETLRPKFLDLVESLQDFEPTMGNSEDNEK